MRCTLYINTSKATRGGTGAGREAATSFCRAVNLSSLARGSGTDPSPRRSMALYFGRPSDDSKRTADTLGEPSVPRGGPIVHDEAGVIARRSSDRGGASEDGGGAFDSSFTRNQPQGADIARPDSENDLKRHLQVERHNNLARFKQKRLRDGQRDARRRNDRRQTPEGSQTEGQMGRTATKRQATRPHDTGPTVEWTHATNRGDNAFSMRRREP